MNKIILLFLLITHISLAQDSTLRVMSYNIWNGFEWGKDQERKIKCLEFIKNQSPDVVAFQELCAYTEEMLQADAQKIGHPYSILLKNTGYSVGLTSRNPIILKEKALEGFWHGMLYCETYGIAFFVVHFSPFDYGIRHKEAERVLERISKLPEGTEFMVLGDFNAHSPYDVEYMENNAKLKAFYRAKKNGDYSDLHNNEFDYSVLSRFLGVQMVDVVQFNAKPENRYSFPTPALVSYDGVQKSPQDLIDQRVRIDYILTSPGLGKSCTEARILNDSETALLSDHYPVIAKFRF